MDLVHLNTLLGKVACPIILNGKLLCYERSPLLISRPNYSREYRISGKSTVFGADFGDRLIHDQTDLFASKYGDLLQGTGIRPTELLPPSLDPFTGAIILESAAFHEISKLELHGGENMQFQSQVYETLSRFVIEYTVDWFDIYLYLFNRRITAQYMPYVVRGHFVSGLFQPLVVETKAIKSPLSFGENAWFRKLFAEYEEQLKLPGETDKRISLSAIAMCDVATVFNVPPIFNLDRKLWVFMMILLLVLNLDPEESGNLSKKYPTLLRQVLNNPLVAMERQGRILSADEREFLEHQNYAALFVSMTDYVTHRNQQLRTV